MSSGANTGCPCSPGLDVPERAQLSSNDTAHSAPRGAVERSPEKVRPWKRGRTAFLTVGSRSAAALHSVDAVGSPVVWKRRGRGCKRELRESTREVGV